MFTSRPNKFDSTNVIETGPSDCQKLIASFFNAYFKKLPPKIIEYRNYKNFHISYFLYEFDQELAKRSYVSK